MDPFLDYSVDEGVDWEEDNPEEDINEQVEEDSDEDSEDNSIMGDWMVGDDEIEFEEDVELSPGKVRAELPMSDAFAMEDKAARAKAATEAAIAKRKVDKLVPFIKGPIWEAKYSVAAWEGFEAYKIGFLNGEGGSGVSDVHTILMLLCQTRHVLASTPSCGSQRRCSQMRPKASSNPMQKPRSAPRRHQQ